MKIIIIILMVLSMVSAEYIRDDKRSIVKDTLNNLMWQDTKGVEIRKKSWKEAIQYCDNLKWLGYDNWRLPTINELYSIVDLSKKAPAINSAFKHVTIGLNDWYWSSTTYFKDYEALAVGFHYGHDFENDKSNIYFIRCVRGF